ncbi:hypothetical protein Taro_026576 [Colocasia esculenta]|uniref:Uncharacterized protein n=1 Tax=Colocasia esculenta TaxID=4460 RepID=A0A843VNZ8_COLES|nr:hypothetical protein [Colocasia esculenta]
MLGFFRRAHKPTRTPGMTVLRNVSSPMCEDAIIFGPLSSNTPRRWKKPVDSAQTRLENRTRDLRFDKLMIQLKKLRVVLGLQEVISSRKRHYASLQLLSKCRGAVGLNVGIGAFLRKYPHIFEIYSDRVRRNICCRLTQNMAGLIEEEARVIKESEVVAVQRLKKLLMMSKDGTLHVHALWLVRRELGLPEDFRDSVLSKHSDVFRLVSPEVVSIASREETFQAEVEKWREKECREKWLSEFETRYAFPIQFPTGFKFEQGFREKLRNWQRLQYVKPYEKMGTARIRACGGVERFEKRAVGIIHELLSLTVEKMIEVERLSHFRRDFGMEVNVRELLLKHPGIFYISTKGNTQTVFLREGYSKGCSVEPNAVYSVRRKMLDLVLMGCRNTGLLDPLKKLEKQSDQMIHKELVGGPYDGEWVLPILENLDVQSADYKELGSTGLSGAWDSTSREQLGRHIKSHDKCNIQVEPRCQICALEMEDLDHAFIQCAGVNQVWLEAAQYLKWDGIPSGLEDLWDRCLNNRERSFTGPQKKTVVAYLLEAIWRRRNKHVFERKDAPGDLNFKSILLAATCFAEANLPAKIKVKHPSLRNVRNRNYASMPQEELEPLQISFNNWWEKPENGWLKGNFDGARKEDQEWVNSGAGFILRNDMGTSLSAGAIYLKQSTILKAEILAAKHLLLSAEKFRNQCYEGLIIEGDNAVVIEAIKDPVKAPLEIRELAKEISCKINSWHLHKVCLIARKANKAADWLAKQARIAKFNVSWTSTLPEDLNNICRSEASRDFYSVWKPP